MTYTALYQVREVDVDEHLGEVAVLEERDVGGAADRGVELLRARGLGIARAGAAGNRRGRASDSGHCLIIPRLPFGTVFWSASAA